MKLRMFVLSVCGLLLASCGGVSDVTDNEAARPLLCSNAWYQSVERRVTTGDGEAHGPDIGTDEWKSVVEFRLDVRGEPDVPDRSSSDWCFFIESLISDDEVTEVGIQQPSFDCSAVAEGSVESLICGNVDLAEMDRQLASVYDQATQIAANEEPQILRAEQIGWIRGRDECWQTTHQLYCIYGEYQRRIAELEARYRLVPFVGP